jgi:uncharacterized protein YfeS
MLDDITYDDHDPWNESSHRHPRANAIMTDDRLWDCVNELAPFGSDEGADAYIEYRSWRAENPDANLEECLSWILGGQQAGYNESLIASAGIESYLSGSPDSVLDLPFPDALTLDTTIIATVLGQLVDEGRIDENVKTYARVAVARQMHPLILAQIKDDVIAQERRAVLELVLSAIEAG